MILFNLTHDAWAHVHASTNLAQTARGHPPHTHTDCGIHVGLQVVMNALLIAEICGQSAAVVLREYMVLHTIYPLHLTIVRAYIH